VTEKPVLAPGFGEWGGLGPDTPTVGARPCDAEDTVAVQGRLAGGGVFNMTARWSVHHGSGIRVEAYGSAGTLVLERDGRLYGARGGDLSELEVPPSFGSPSLAIDRVGRFVVLFGEMAAAIRGEPVDAGYATFDDGVRVREIAETVIGASSRRWVRRLATGSLPPGGGEGGVLSTPWADRGVTSRPPHAGRTLIIDSNHKGADMAETLTSGALSRLRELEDRAEITDIVNRYGQGVRTGDVDLLCSLFTADAVIDHGHGTVVEGAEAIRAHFGGAAKSAVGRSVLTFDQRIASTPIMTNTLVTIDGDIAHCESMCLAIHAGMRDEQAMVMVRGTRNVDDLVRTRAGWRIRRRVHPALWKFELPGEAYGDAD
jgi:ketosteroid isomerase-like protein